MSSNDDKRKATRSTEDSKLHEEVRSTMFEAVKVSIEQQTILNESLMTSSDPRKLFILHYQEDYSIDRKLPHINK